MASSREPLRVRGVLAFDAERLHALLAAVDKLERITASVRADLFVDGLGHAAEMSAAYVFAEEDLTRIPRVRHAVRDHVRAILHPVVLAEVLLVEPQGETLPTQDSMALERDQAHPHQPIDTATRTSDPIL